MTPEKLAADAYITTLKEKYRSAVKHEQDALEALESARRRKEVYASTLAEEGVDVRTLDGLAQPALDRTKNQHVATVHIDHRAPAGQRLNGNSEIPLSNTHAVFMLMRKHGNTGFSFRSLQKLATQEGYTLTEETIRRVFWKQQTERRMERMESGKIRLTKLGETFNRFRVQKAEK